MTSIAKLLQEYSKESAELEVVDPVGEVEDPVEEIVEIAELEDEIEEATGAVLEGEGNDVEEAVHTLVEANESLESSLNFLEAMREEHGEISPLAAQLFQASIVDSMEARGIPFEALVGDATYSFESKDAGDTEVAKKGFFARIWAMIKAAFQRMREWITRFFAWFRTSGKAVKAAAEKLLKVAEEKKKAGAKAEGKTYNQAPFADLAMGGKIDPVKAISQLNSARQDVYASAGALVNTSIEAVEMIKKEAASPSKDAGVVAKLLGKTVEDSKRRYIKDLAGMMQKTSLATLPGDRILQVKVEETKKGFRAKITMIKGENGPAAALAKTDRFAPVLGLDEIIRLAKAIIELVDHVDTQAGAFEKAFEKTKGFDSFIPKDAAGPIAEMRELAGLISQGTTASRSIVSEFSKHVFPIAKRGYAAGVICLRQYK